MEKKYFSLADKAGNVQPRVEINVYRTDTGLPATLYANYAGTVLKANPFFTDSNGYGEFYAADGIYHAILISEDGDEKRIDDIVCADLRSGVVGGGSGSSLYTNVKAFNAIADDNTDDYDPIQAAINASSGRVIIDDGGMYLCGNTLKLKSDTEFVVGHGAILKLKAGTNKPLLTNVAYLAPKTAVTITSSNQTATVTWASHNKQTGDPISITEAAGQPDLNGAWLVESVVNGNQLTYRLDKPVTTSAVAAKACDADKNLVLEVRGTVDGNYSQQTALDDNTRQMIIIHNAVGVRIRGGQFKNATKYAIYLVNCRDFVVEGVDFDTQHDCVHVSANCRRGVIEGGNGRTVSGDIVRITTSNADQYKLEDGSVTGVTVRDVRSKRSNTFVKISGKTGYEIDDVIVEGLRGITDSDEYVRIADDGAALTGTVVNRVSLRDVRSQRCGAVMAVGTGVVVDSCVLDSIGAAFKAGGVVLSNLGTVRRVLGSNWGLSGTGSDGGGVYNEGTINYFNLDGVGLDASNLIGWLFAHSSAQSTVVNISNVAGSTAGGVLISNGLVNIALDNVQLNASSVLLQANTSGAAIVGRLRNCFPVTTPVSVVGGTCIVYGNDQTQDVPYAASITPDFRKGTVVNVGTLGSSITVNNAVGVPPAGELVTFVFDAGSYVSGTRAITWDANYVFSTAFTQAVLTTDANKKTVVTFRSSGTKLHATGGNVWA